MHVASDDLGHKPGKRATTGRHRLKHTETFTFFVKRALNGVDLPSNPPDSLKQLLLFASRVCHPCHLYCIPV